MPVVQGHARSAPLAEGPRRPFANAERNHAKFARASRDSDENQIHWAIQQNSDSALGLIPERLRPEARRRLDARQADALRKREADRQHALPFSVNDPTPMPPERVYG